MRRRPMLIGISGQIGAGKSTVAEILRSCECTVISGDEIGRFILDTNAVVKRKLVREFGEEIVTSDGSIDRKALGAKAFQSERERRKLNAIVHPPLLKELNRRIRKARKGKRSIVIDATLLIEWGYHRKMDEVIIVTAPRIVRHRRLGKKGLTESQVRARERLQLTQSVFVLHGTKVFRNTGSARLLRREVIQWFKNL